MAFSGLCNKADDTVSEHVEMSDSPKDPERAPAIERYTYAERRKITRKIDFRIVFPLGLMMAASFLDRANIANAAIAG